MRWTLCLVALVMSGLLESPVEVEAVDYQANMKKATRFLGLGYNLLKADPDAKVRGGVDPGVLTQFRVVDVIANGTEAFPRHSCVTGSYTSTIYDEKSFQKKFDMDVKAEATVSTSVVEARFAMSTSFAQARDQTTREKTMSFEQQTLCNLGGARMKTEMGRNRASESFQTDVCALPESYDINAYAAFIDKWGTGVITQLDIGIRALSTKKETFSSVYKSMMDSLGVGVSTSVSYSGVLTSGSGSLEMNMNKVENSQNLRNSFKGQETNVTIGNMDFPEPIFIRTAGLHTFLTADFFGSSNPPGCTAAKLAQLSAKQSNLKKALDAYPAHKQAQVTNSNGKVRIPLAWPRGNYGFLKSYYGCPSGWGEGRRTWDCEDDRNENSKTVPNHIFGYVTRNIQLSFCMKRVPVTNSLTDLDWPKGEYCFYRYRSCPEGFTSSSIKWDDEDSSNENTYRGLMPEGTYNKDTVMYFCCRRDGHITSPIFLPTDRPFYLMQSDRYGCQQVAGMNVRSEYIKWDTADDSNKDKASSGAPYHTRDKSDWTLFYCFYSKK